MLPSQWWKLADQSVRQFETLRFDPRDFVAARQAPTDPAYVYGQSWPSGAKRWEPGDLYYHAVREVGDSGTQIYNDLTAWGVHPLNAGADGGDTYRWILDAQGNVTGIIVKEAKGRGRVYAMKIGDDGLAFPIDTGEVIEGFGETGFFDRWGALLPFLGAAVMWAITTYAPAAVAGVAPAGQVIPGPLTAVGTGEVIATGASAVAAPVATATGGTVAASTVAGGGFVSSLAQAASSAAQLVGGSFDIGKFVQDLSKLYVSFELQKRAGASVTAPKAGTQTVLPDGSILRINADGSTTITRPDGTVATIGTSGQIMPGVSGGSNWIAGIDNFTLLVGGAGAVLLLTLMRRRG